MAVLQFGGFAQAQALFAAASVAANGLNHDFAMGDWEERSLSECELAVVRQLLK